MYLHGRAGHLVRLSIICTQCLILIGLNISSLCFGASVDFSLVAGTTLGGEGGNSLLYFPNGATFGPDGKLYVADTENHRLVRVGSEGILERFAGLSGAPGSTDGIAQQARFNRPGKIVCDSSGILWVSDFGSAQLRRVSSAGEVTTVCGLLGAAGALMIGSDGNIWAAGDSWIGFYSPTKKQFFYVVSPVTVPQVPAFGDVSSMVEPSPGKIWVVDRSPNKDIGSRYLRAFDFAGRELESPNLTGPNGELNALLLYGMTKSADGKIYALASETGSEIDSIASVSTDGSYVWYRSYNYESPGAYVPTSIICDENGDVYAVDSLNGTIYSWKSLSRSKIFGPRGPVFATPSLVGPASQVTVDNLTDLAVSKDGKLLLGDGSHGVLRSMDSSRYFDIVAGQVDAIGYRDGARSSALVSTPLGVVELANGEIFFCEPQYSTLRKVWADGSVSTVAGTPGEPGTADGAAGTGRLIRPVSIAIESDGSILIADAGANAIRRLSPSGLLSTVSGNRILGTIDGPVETASWVSPFGIVVNSDGNIYVAQASCVRKIGLDGYVSTVAGDPIERGYVDGEGSVSRFSQITSLKGGPGAFVTVADGTMLRTISTDGVVKTIAGAPSTGLRLGTGLLTNFGGQLKFAYDANGDIYVADNYWGRLLKGSRLDDSLRIVNFSARANYHNGEGLPILGISISGDNVSIVGRSIGPSLKQFGVSDTTANAPLLALNDEGNILYSTEGDISPQWLNALFDQVGAFRWIDGNSETGFVIELSGGVSYLCPTDGTGDGRNILLEAYDASNAESSKLNNCSIRGLVSKEESIVCGLVVRGSGIRQFLIRGTSRSLRPFGVSSLLTKVGLRISSGDDSVTEYAAGSYDPISDASVANVGAFPISDPSTEVSLVIPLSQGNYTVEAFSDDTFSGVALIEVFEIPND